MIRIEHYCKTELMIANFHKGTTGCLIPQNEGRGDWKNEYSNFLTSFYEKKERVEESLSSYETKIKMVKK